MKNIKEFKIFLRLLKEAKLKAQFEQNVLNLHFIECRRSWYIKYIFDNANYDKIVENAIMNAFCWSETNESSTVWGFFHSFYKILLNEANSITLDKGDLRQLKENCNLYLERMERNHHILSNFIWRVKKHEIRTTAS